MLFHKGSISQSIKSFLIAFNLDSILRALPNLKQTFKDYINASTYPSYQIPDYERRHYFRTNHGLNNAFKGNMNQSDYTNISPDVLNHNAVIKGIPISSQIVPCPYYLPDDFVLIQFDHASPGQNIQQYDTITISGSEVYSVIDGAYNQTNRTRGILFCARTT